MLKKSMHFSLKLFLECLLGLFVLGLIAIGTLAGFLAKGPIDLTSWAPKIEQQINNQLSSNTVKLATLSLEWQSETDFLGLKASDVILSNDRGPFLYTPEISMDVSLRSLLVGRFHLESISIKNIALAITRSLDGQIRISGAPLTETTDDNKETAIPAILTLNDLINDLPSLDSLWINNARLIYTDKINDKTQRFDPVTLLVEMHKDDDDRRILQGYIKLPFEQSDVKQIVQLNFATEPDPTRLAVYANIEEVALDHFLQFAPTLPAGLNLNMVVDADIKAQLDNLWNLEVLEAHLNADKGQVIYALDDQETIVGVSDLNLVLSTDRTDGDLVIEPFTFTFDKDVKIAVKGTLKNFNDFNTLGGHLSLDVQNLSQETLKQYWPANATDNGAYEWLAEKMSNGTFDAITLDMAFDQSRKTRTDSSPLPPELLSVKGKFAYSDMTIDYRSPLAQAEHVNGTGEYNDISLSLDIASADIGGLKVKDATLFFDDLITSGAGHATLKFPITGEMQSVFDYIAEKPISAFDNVDFKPVNAKGQADLVADIKFPLAKDTPIDAFDVLVKGTANDITLNKAIKNLTLSGGPFNLEATTSDIKMNGSGQLAGNPITLDWHEYFSTESAGDYLSKMTATLTANNTIRESFLNDFSKYFAGQTRVKLDYEKDKNGKTSNIAVDLDLKDTKVESKSLGLLKQAGTASTASLNVKLNNGYLTDLQNMVVNGKDVSLGSGNISFMTIGNESYIQGGSLKKLLFGENKISVDFDGNKDKLTTKVSGAFLDARPILGGEKDTVSKDVSSDKGLSRQSEIVVDVIEMRTADEATLTNVRLSTLSGTTGQLEKFDMNATAGRGNLMVKYNPYQDERLSLQVESNNAGDTLRAFDLYPNIQGGTLRIAGIPLKGGRFGDVRGQVRIDNFAVTNGPVLVPLLNALSFKEGGKNLLFTRLESDFEWRIGENGDIYTISNGRTAGASVGLTFDGYVDTAMDTIDMKGTAAPLTGINNLVSNIPIIGDIVTGGGGALLAATYSVGGSTADPKISVNPLSVLTPGILRKMLFEGSAPTPETNKQPIEKEEKSALNK